MANGETIFAIRTGRGLTQEQLALAADVDVKTVRKAEQGKRLDLGTLTQLAYALDCSLQTLIVRSPSESDLQVLRRDVVLRWFRAFSQKDSERFLNCYHDAAHLHLPGGPLLPFAGMFRGKAEIRQAMTSAWAACPFAPVPDQDFSLIVSDETVVLTGQKSIALSDGQQFWLRCIHVFEFTGDLIVAQQVQYDTLELARVLRLLPERHC